MEARSLRGASGQLCRIPLGPRFDPEIARWNGQPDGVVLAHACALSSVAIIDRLAETWPHREFAGNAERDWRDVLSLTCALRHVRRTCQRSRDSERRMRAMQRDGWRIGEDHEALQPLVDLDAFEACGMPCCPLPRTVGDPEPFGDDPLRTTLASHHHAVAAVEGDVLWILELSLAHVGALRPREDWRDAIVRCGTNGPDLLRAAWQASTNAIALGADAPMPGGRCYRRPAVWPADYWPAWHGITGLLAKEMASAAAAGLAQPWKAGAQPRLRPKKRKASLALQEEDVRRAVYKAGAAGVLLRNLDLPAKLQTLKTTENGKKKLLRILSKLKAVGHVRCKNRTWFPTMPGEPESRDR